MPDVPSHAREPAPERDLLRLAQMVEHSGEAMFSKDADGLIRDWNPAAERLYGFTAAEMIGQPTSRLIPPEMADDDVHLLRRALGGETISRHLAERVRKDGERISVALTVAPLFDDVGEPAGVTVVAHDVTEQLRAEREREEALSQLAEAQALARLGSWTWDVTSGVTTWSPEMYRIFDRDPADGAAGWRELLGYLHPDDRQLLDDAFAMACGGDEFDLDYRIVLRSGAERVVHARGRLERDGRYAGTVQEVTSLRATERQAKASARRFEQTLENAPIGIALVAPDGRWLKANRALCEILGYSEKELLGLSFQQITHPEDLDTDLEFVRQLLAGETVSYRMHKRYFHRSGRTVWAELSVSLMRDDSGKPVHFISQIQDITAERAAHEALAASERRYQSIAANVPGMVYRFTMTPSGEARFSFVSAGSREIYQLEPEALMADASLAVERIHPDDRAAWELSVMASAANLSRWEWRGRQLMDDGTVKHLHVIAQPIRESDGKIVWDGVVSDETGIRAAQELEAQTRERLQAVLESLAGSAVTVFDRDHRLRFSEGPLFDQISEDPRAGALADLTTPETAEMMGPGIERALAGETSTAVVDADRYDRTLALRFAPYRVNGGIIEGALVHWHDITPVRRAERQRDEALELFQIAFERAPIGMAVVGLDGRLERVNEALCEMTGYAAGDLATMQALSITHPEDADTVALGFASLGSESDTRTSEYRIVRADGDSAWVQACVTLIRDDAGKPAHALAQLLDITDRRAYEERLRHLADHDALTGLLNRRGFESTLERHLASCRRYGPAGALLVLDLDGFKLVNDTLGHAAGDDLIVACGHALKDRLREGDVVARLGGDEFAVLLPAQNRREAEQVARALIDTVRACAAEISDAHPGRITASIGIAPFGEEQVTADEMLARADQAMYEAKDGGKDRAALYSSDGHVEPRLGAQMSWLERVEKALAEERFALQAQPVVDLATGETIQHEVLVRMCGDRGDLIPPSTFLYVAERFGVIRELDRWIVTRAIRQMAVARAAGQAFPLAVNISGLSTSDGPLLETISRELREGNVPAGDLTVEISEAAAVADIPRARRFAEALREIGCQFALDDFGAGFGSFYYLKHLPFDLVKIDGEFVRHATENPADRLVIKAVADIATRLGKRTVAEFVPNESTIRLLLQHGIDFGQGHYLGRPRPLEEIAGEHLEPVGADHP